MARSVDTVEILKNTYSWLVFLCHQILVVFWKAKVQVGAGVRRAAEHVFAVTHAALCQLILATEGSRILELADAALILCRQFQTFNAEQRYFACKGFRLILQCY